MTDTKKGFFNSLPGFRSGKIAKKIIAVGLIYIPLIISKTAIIVQITALIILSYLYSLKALLQNFQQLRFLKKKALL